MIKKIKSNFNIYYKIQIFCIMILTTALILLGWAYLIEESNNYKESIIKNYSINQENLVSQVTKNVKESLETAASKNGYSLEKAEEAVVFDILKKAETSGSKYWFLYSSEGVIFEKDTEATRNLKGKNLSELVRHWKLQGGYGTEAFEELLIQEHNGSAVFTKDNDLGEEVVSVKNFTVGHRNYFLGMSSQQSYVMSAARASEHILYLQIFSGLVSLDILIFALFSCLLLYKNHKESEKLNRSLVNKSLQIQELTRKVSAKSEAVQNASIYDRLTRLYNRKFFDNLLLRINHDLLMPVSIIILDINGLGLLNVMNGYSAGDELLEKTSEILHRVCIDTDIVARTGSSEFTILMTGTRESEAYGTAENIKRQFCNLDNSDLTLSVGVAQMHANETSVFTVMELARKNLILDKMMDSNSSSNSMVSMLMETLNIYSCETVEHSTRIKEMAISLGRVLGMTPSEISRLAVAAQLHDVGKIGIPDSILMKKEALTEQERELIRRHSELGFNIVKAIPFLDGVAIDILHHHECYDGTGYPNGLRGEEISLNGRILNIIDSFDAMINKNIYSRTKTVEEAVIELRQRSNLQYDPHLVNEFVKEIAGNFIRSREVN